MHRRGYTLIELMIVVVMLSIVGLIAYPQITDSLRKLRAREGAKSVVNSVLIARSQAMIRNTAYRIRITSSSTVGSLSTTGGGKITISRSNLPSCTAAGAVFTDMEIHDYASLGDINLCLIRTTASPEVTSSTSCADTTVDLCVSPDGTTTNLLQPTAANTIIYIRENTVSSGSNQGVGVVRQVVIPRRKSVQAHPIQVTNDECL